MRLIRSLPVVLPLFSTALADVEFIAPARGTIMKAGDVVTAHWKDSGESPRISELVQYDLYLCAGGDTLGSQENLATLIKDGVFARGNSVSFKIDPAVGGNEPNAYFLKMVASGPDAHVINFSDRFTLTGMAGAFSSNLEDGIGLLSESHGQQELRRRQAVGAYTIPYQLQTGPTRYAPMAKKPGSTIPADKSPTPQFPTSAYEIATAYLSAPTIQTTVSASLTYSVSSIENTASPAPHPHDKKMKRFLERWKD
ncbi:Ser-Thr-rich glycosyl-phosphatidyl-inositol-anchored membrane family protein [Aspergillus parasiticus SU-1]|uniref:Ser-Thr-rich glycosyl-phosphatidyl-inositol-anchored membrane family-domain-containing protein n=3 Tax=Aspergillus subgen. Circumdati TaxID=2720871 RepID=A0A5N6D712_ASPPA|nr:Ser-Thr-rich glycosyl-phosphatidyl-inositol-anchored membrane family-domain-containing protein [Aspergillus parasiticus]KAE8308181.1 Ser-Thr-rich glycosyl-phosphatidyl-inositol-anchored membrane family-domain-containing protein [Aspergillus transmontanensis]KJK61542.1 Ser-Thr-rich glycosyl-phosphatidyl-inositol-anchored membrane family protein [Aspergillus parasiticus SU-1]